MPLASADESIPASTVSDKVLEDQVRRDALVIKLKDLVTHGAFDELIEVASAELNRVTIETPDKRVLFLRGHAAWMIGFFGMAERDFSQTGAYSFEPTWLTSSNYLARIRAMKALAPPRIHEIKHAGKVAFRVYYEEQDEWTSAIIALLPDAYEINQKMLGHNLDETPVFIFSNYEHFKSFYELRSGGVAASWGWAQGGLGMIYFCKGAPRANLDLFDINSDFFKTNVIHEFNHCMVYRIACATEMPTWVAEGLATIAETRFSSSVLNKYKERMQRARTANAILPIAALNDRKNFLKTTEESVTLQQKGEAGAEPYIQSYFLGSYLITLLPPEGLGKFLSGMGREGFWPALKKQTGLSEEEFYRNWLEWLPQQLN
jgi:hypothetical protein